MIRRDEKMREESFHGEAVIGRWISPEWPRHLTPVRLLIILAVAVFVAEVVIMLIMSQLPPVTGVIQPVIDATILLLLLSPSYYFLFLPLKKHYAEHLRSDLEIRRLSSQMIRAIESEKKRLARELHDEFGQTLTALQFGIESIRSSQPGAGAEERRQLDYLRKLVGRLSDHIRDITSDLRPPLLENCGLGDTLQWHVEELKTNGCGFEIETELEECPRLDPDIEITIFRICQEGLNNVSKHAGASRARIRLFYDSHRVGLILEDDGRGFSDSGQQKMAGTPPGVGLIGMRERIAAVGGRLMISSTLGKGTRIWARIPLAYGSLP
jgi:signal transduction histidine kinase